MQQPAFNIQKVAVIGAGISGIAAAKYLSEANLSVVVFERASSLGGLWVYDDRPPPESPYPNVVPSSAETTPRSLDRAADKLRDADKKSVATLLAQHAPPGPAYVSLRNNIPTCLMSFKDQTWPAGTHDYINHTAILDYIRMFAKTHNVERLVQFNTRVTRIVKEDSGWSVDTSTLSVESPNVQHKIQNQHFDAIVICSGHHSAPKIPDIRGLAELKLAWPHHITHAKSYRRPEDVIGKNIVLVGNGASAYDIAQELKDRVQKLYQVTNKSGYIPLQFMPEIVERVGEIAFVENKTEASGVNGNTTSIVENPAIRVHLIDGTILEDVHSIVLCTGYVRSYPFLTQYHDDHVVAKDADDTVLITDGTMLHNLHKDIFYMPDPTLSFVGVSTGTTSLSLHEYQAMVISSFLSGQVPLPSEAEMREEYRARLDKKGAGRKMHNLMGQEVEYVNELVKHVNSSRQSDPVEGYSKEWLATYDKRTEWLKEVFMNPKKGDVMKPEGRDIRGICTSDGPGYL